jgi:hypothetical protein
LLPPEVIALEQEYWLRRTRESLAKAWKAESAEARLIHFDLAGRYSVRAADCDQRLATKSLP